MSSELADTDEILQGQVSLTIKIRSSYPMNNEEYCGSAVRSFTIPTSLGGSWRIIGESKHGCGLLGLLSKVF